MAKNGWELKNIIDSNTGNKRLARVLYQNGKIVEQHWLDSFNKSDVPEVQLLLDRRNLLYNLELLRENKDILRHTGEGEFMMEADEEEVSGQIEEHEHVIFNKIPKQLLKGIPEDYQNGQTLLWDPEGEELRQRVTKYYKLPQDTFKKLQNNKEIKLL